MGCRNCLGSRRTRFKLRLNRSLAPGAFFLSTFLLPQQHLLLDTMDDENEVLDWDNEDDEPRQDGDSRSFDCDDADDAVSLGDDDEQPSFSAEVINPIPHSLECKPESSTRKEPPSQPAERKVDGEKDRYDNHGRSRRDSPPPRSHRAMPNPTRITHALPPKPVAAAAVVTPPNSGRATSMKTAAGRSSSDTKSFSTVSPTSPTRHTSGNHDSIGAWEVCVSRKGETFYYNNKTGESSWDKPPGMVSHDDGHARNVPAISSRSSPPRSNIAVQDFGTARNSQSQSRPNAEDGRYYRPTDSSIERAPEARRTDRGGESLSREPPARDRERHPETRRDEPYSRSNGVQGSSWSRVRGRSPSPRARELERAPVSDSRSRARTSATDIDSREQTGRSYDDSRRPPRRGEADTYIPGDDRSSTRPPPRMASPEPRPVAAPSTLSASCNHHHICARARSGLASDQPSPSPYDYHPRSLRPKDLLPGSPFLLLILLLPILVSPSFIILHLRLLSRGKRSHRNSLPPFLSSRAQACFATSTSSLATKRIQPASSS